MKCYDRGNCGEGGYCELCPYRVVNELFKYLKALEIGDPDKQLVNPEDNVKIVRLAIRCLNKMIDEKISNIEED